MRHDATAIPEFLSLNPADPSQELGRFRFMGSGEIQKISDSAAQVKQTWSSDAVARSNALKAASALIRTSREELENLIVLEVGKPCPYVVPPTSGVGFRRILTLIRN